MSLLGDSADVPRFIETLPRRGYRFVGRTDGLAPVREERLPQRRTIPALWIAVAITLLLGLAVVVAVKRASRVPSWRRPLLLTRLTSDPGLQMQPSWSPDGRFIAYASDKSGNFDIWVQPVAGGDAVRVTTSREHDWEPDWSPDGSQIAFRSERQGGGVFMVPALGGTEQRLSTLGHRPRWSPDGSRLVVSAMNLAGHSEVPELYIVRLDGSPPRPILRELLPDLRTMPALAWHPDGRRVSLWGGHRIHGLSFWTLPVDGGGPAVRSQRAPRVQEAMASARLDNFHRDAFAWAPRADALFFVGTSRGVRNTWRVQVDPLTLEWTDGPERITAGPGADTDVAVSRDGLRILFASSQRNAKIWLFPFDARTGRLSGGGQPITDAGSYASLGDVTTDHRRLLYWVGQPGRRPHERLVQRSTTGDEPQELILEDTDRRWHFAPRWSPDGKRISYRVWIVEGGRATLCSIELLDPRTGVQTQLTSPQARHDNPWGWSPDGQWIVAPGPRYVAGQDALVLLPVAGAPSAESRARVVTSDHCHWFWQASMSPDSRWVALQVAPRADTRVSTIFVVPSSGGQWIQITEGVFWDDKPRWAPDGRILYFVSDRGGVFNVWGSRIEPVTGMPVGDVFRVTSFSGPQRMLEPRIGAMEIGITLDRLVLPIVDVTGGGIWMLENVVNQTE
jgi:Tol biopolymer transport system component